jgi:hypothetical protein
MSAQWNTSVKTLLRLYYSSVKAVLFLHVGAVEYFCDARVCELYQGSITAPLWRY